MQTNIKTQLDQAYNHNDMRAFVYVDVCMLHVCVYILVSSWVGSRLEKPYILSYNIIHCNLLNAKRTPKMGLERCSDKIWVTIQARDVE